MMLDVSVMLGVGAAILRMLHHGKAAPAVSTIQRWQEG